MTVYTIRPEFTIELEAVIYLGGEDVDLNDAEFEFHKHKLEGVEATAIPLQVQGDVEGINNECCFPAPFVKSVTPDRLKIGGTVSISISGSFFTPSTTVDIPDSTINNVEFLNSQSLLVSLTAGATPGLYDLTIDNGKQSIVSQRFELFESEKIIVDLRSGGTAFSNAAIEMQSGMSWERNGRGMVFNDANSWSDWVRFVGDNDNWVWNRTDLKKLSWIFTNTSTVMLGFGSRENDPDSNDQYYQGEIYAYINGEIAFYGFFGNNGNPGSGNSQNSGFNFNAGALKKIVVENNGEPGSNFYLYELSSADPADWTDTSNLIYSGVIASNMTANAQVIMPSCIARSGSSTSFLGFILEDM